MIVFAAIYFVMLYLQGCMKRSALGAILQLSTRTLGSVVPPSCVDKLGPGFNSPHQLSIFSTFCPQIAQHKQLFALRTRFGPIHVCFEVFTSFQCHIGGIFSAVRLAHSPTQQLWRS